ncbi:MAG: hypothetical protein NTY76_07675 [Candidatus Omnitrophica bacterium]|nr:hypothetical protein [Candidatus Omnitrophota bacterium]
MIKKLIRTIAVIELSIGAFTICGITIYGLLAISRKPLNVFIFVFLAGVASSVIGMGLFNYKHWARNLLIFFSGYIILIKIMIFADLLHLNGEIMTFPPASLKNYISIAYHGFIVLFLTRQTVKECFIKNELRN